MSKKGHYLFDESHLAGNPEHGESFGLKHDQNKNRDDMHWGNLFDDDEDRAGNKFNEQTGEPINNSDDLGLDGLTIVDTNGLAEFDNDLQPPYETALEEWQLAKLTPDERATIELQYRLGAEADAWLAEDDISRSELREIHYQEDDSIEHAA